MRFRSVIASTLGLALFALAGCASEAEPAATPDQTQTQEQLGGKLTIWAEQRILDALGSTIEQFELDTGVDIQVAAKNFAQIDGAALAELGSATGPDILIGPHTWTGALVDAGAVSSIEDLKIGSDFTTSSVNAFRYSGNQYGFGFVTENVALVCGKDAVSAQPANWDELTAQGIKVAMSQPTVDPYHLYFAQSSFGAPLFVSDETGSYTSDLGLGTEGGAAFASWFATQSKNFVFADYEKTLSAMVSADADCWVTGPWSVAALGDVDREFVAYKLPATGDYEAKPFMSAQGFFLAQKAADSAAAKKFLKDYLATEVAQKDIYQQLGGTPAHKQVLKLVKDPLLVGFAEAGLDADPVPSISQMQFVWSPWSKALTLIASGEEPTLVWQNFVAEIQGLIGITQ